MEKTYVSWNEYVELRDRINEAKDNAFELMGDAARKAWDEMEELKKKLDRMRPHIMPEVGMGCTEILYSDRRAKTIVEVVNPNTIVVMENETKCRDYYGGVYEVLPELNVHMPAETYTRRKSGRWVAKGQPDKFGSVFLAITYQKHYIDPSF